MLSPLARWTTSSYSSSSHSYDAGLKYVSSDSRNNNNNDNNSNDSCSDSSSSSSTIKVDVCIVGCGPVGAFASILLRQMGVSHVVLDRRTQPTSHPQVRRKVYYAFANTLIYMPN